MKKRNLEPQKQQNLINKIKCHEQSQPFKAASHLNHCPPDHYRDTLPGHGPVE
jgi:hypothetical protein